MASYVGNKPLFGNFDKLDDISSSFNGSANTFAMTSNSRGVTAGDETQVVISLNGVIQEPVTDYFLATTGQIQFTTAPASGTAFFGYVTGNIGGTASTITDGIVTTAKLANTAGTGSAVQLAANTSTLTIAANGNIGIGTTSPAAKTDVVVSSGENIRLTKATGAYLGFHDSTQTRAALQGINGADGLTFHTGSAVTERVRIDGSGKVGIGTTNPQQILHLDGSSSDTTIQITNSASGGSATDGFSLTVENPSGDVNIRNREATNMRLYTSNSERVRIDSNGNVGIGTTNTGTGKTTIELTGVAVTGDTDGATIGSSGIVNLYRNNGSTNSTVMLLSGDSDLTVGQIASGIGFTRESSSNWGTQLRFYTHSINTSDLDELLERMRLDSSGNLQVGQTSNDAHLNTASGDGLTITQSGEILQGTTGESMILNRRGSDGKIIRLRRSGTTIGSIGVDGTDNFYLTGEAGNTGGIYMNDAAVSPAYQGTERDNYYDLGKAPARWKDLYLSGGVVFGTTGGSVTSKTLDDYEEGTFTAAAWGGGSISNQVCKYTKVGNLVTFIARVIYNTTSNNDAAGFTGLPFTAGSTDADRGGVVSYANYGASFYALVINSGTRVIFYNLNGGTLLNSNFSGKQVFVSGHYYI